LHDQACPLVFTCLDTSGQRLNHKNDNKDDHKKVQEVMHEAKTEIFGWPKYSDAGPNSGFLDLKSGFHPSLGMQAGGYDVNA